MLLIFGPVFLCLKVRFKGPLTYLKSADQRYTPTRPLQEDSDASWAMLVDGKFNSLLLISFSECKTKTNMTWWSFLLIKIVSTKLSSLLAGNIDVCICPGDHLALGEPEDGAVVGGILATAVSVRYRTLCPSLPRLPTSLKQRRAIGKFEAGVNVLLYSKKGTIL